VHEHFHFLALYQRRNQYVSCQAISAYPILLPLHVCMPGRVNPHHTEHEV